MDRGVWQAVSTGSQESDTTEHTHTEYNKLVNIKKKKKKKSRSTDTENKLAVTSEEWGKE